MTDVIPFTKMQGAGNDFVLLDGARGSERDWSALAVPLCSRHFGVGADGLLVALPSAQAGVRMRMFNPDGTEDECGNGLRCLALYAYRRGLVSTPEFVVESLSGLKAARVEDGGGPEAQVSIDLGRADLSPAAVPMLHPGKDALGVRVEVGGETLDLYVLSTGTAHTVIFQMPDEERFQRLSPLLEHHPLFPERTSIMWTEMTGPDSARIRIWERGAGETLACGTGASAVAVAAHASGRAGSRVAVTSRGGTLTIDVGPDLAICKTGPATFVFEGEWTAGTPGRGSR